MNHKSVHLVLTLLPAAFALWLLTIILVTIQATTTIRNAALTTTSTGWNDYREWSFNNGEIYANTGPLLRPAVYAYSMTGVYTVTGSAGGDTLTRTNSIFTETSKVFLPLTFRSHPQAKTTLAAGYGHTCALTSGGGVKCWGQNTDKALGNGTWTNRNEPVDVIGLPSSVLSIAAGDGINYALMVDGGTKMWGGWIGGVLTDVLGLPRGVTKVDGRYYLACAITQTGGVKCFWGNSGTGPVDIAGLSSDVIDIATEGWQTPCGLNCWYIENHSCAALGSGGVKCWEQNVDPIPVDVIGLQGNASALAMSGNVVCALLTSGAVTCWDGTSPSIVPSLSSGVAAITGYGGHFCVLTTGGGVKCWGANSEGQLGDGSHDDRTVPVDVVGLSNGVTEIAAGAMHTCARLGTFGPIKCWGANVWGQLGNGTFVSSTIPVDVIGLTSP